MAVVDVYDALLSKRIYRPAIPHETALSMIREGAGAHFDSDMVDGFLEIAGQLPEISRRFGDTSEQSR